ncbi:hypothetical protein ACHAW6_005202 [Cyclotella cf. meneghiniana]
MVCLNVSLLVTTATFITTIQHVSCFVCPSAQCPESATKLHAVSAAVTPRKVVIVGGGIGGLSSAFDARKLLRHDDQICVVSDRESFQFTPSNPWVATRMRTAKDISLDLTEILPRHGIQFVHGRAKHLDPRGNSLTLEGGTKLTYDFLIIATGPRLAFDEIPGAKDHATSTHGNTMVSVCTTPHAEHAAQQIDDLVNNPGPSVVGCTQGASCFGPAYEFALLLHSELKKRGGDQLLHQCPITFVTSEPYIGHLGTMGAGESRKILEQLLNERNVTCHTNSIVTKITSSSVVIETMNNNDKHHNKLTLDIPSKFTMLIPPFRGQHVWKSVPHLTDKNGLISINEFQQSTAYPNIFGVGVCVSIPPVEVTPVATGPPKTGYLIESQGTAAVTNIRSMIDFMEQQKEANSKDGAPELTTVPTLNGLCITDFGGTGAIFLTLPQYPPRHTDVTVQGTVATLAKIAFEKYFLHKVESGDTDPYYEKYMLHLIGVDRVKDKQ